MTLAAAVDGAASRMQVIDADAIEALRASIAAKWLFRSQKRACDAAAAAILLLLLALPMVVVAILVKATSPGPILYRAHRRGLNGRPFTMLKFRSMAVARDEDDRAFRAGVAASGILPKSAGDPRITGLGRWLRRTSIDELPQLLNVLAGDMALIGPRPIMPEMLQLQPGIARARELVRPGLGGLWQVRSREKDNTAHDMWPDDLEYLNRMSFAFDMWLLCRSLVAAARWSDAR